MHVDWESPTRIVAKQSGFTFVEVMVSAALVFVIMGGISYVMVQLGRMRVRSEYIATISAIESSLSTALLDEAKYADPAVKAALRAGTVPSPWSFRVQGNTRATNFDFTIDPGQSVTLDRTFVTCAGFPSPTCVHKISLESGYVSGRMGFAYRFETAQDLTSLNFRGAGDAGTAALNTGNFSLTIPYEYYLNQLQMICDPATTLGAYGLQRDQALASCLQQPQAPCPVGTLPKSLRLDNTTGPDPSVELACVGTQQASCPQNYSLHDLDTRTLDAGAAKAGHCVYATATSAGGPGYGPGSNIWGQACPLSYRSASSCSLTNVTQADGWCPDEFDCTPVPPIDNGDGTFTPQPDYCVLTVPAHVQPPSPGHAALSESGPNVSCSVVIPAQSCGAMWNAQVDLSIGCVLAVPELVNVQ
ncbi:MAG: prepilin-type N-terminal cleavage/methylation domain-containing protein [Bdellovibrionota bacterium]